MKWIGNTELRIEELADSLRFTVVQKDGLVETIAAPLVTVFVVWLFWRQHSQLAKIMAVLASVACAIAILANRRQGDTVTLEVTEDAVTTNGNMGKLFETDQRIASRDIRGMSYRIGDDGALPGLYVKVNWSVRCILPRLSEEQTQQTIDVIKKRFPDIATDSGAFFSIGGDESITTLNLSSPADDQQVAMRDSAEDKASDS